MGYLQRFEDYSDLLNFNEDLRKGHNDLCSVVSGPHPFNFILKLIFRDLGFRPTVHLATSVTQPNTTRRWILCDIKICCDV